jgi:hypothetical protein
MSAKKEENEKHAPIALKADAENPKVAPEVLKNAPEGTVIGQGGMLTKPTVVTVSKPHFKEPSKAKLLAGKVLLEGDTDDGFHRKIIHELPTGVTEEGAVRIFRLMYPNAIKESVKVKMVSDEEAEKLEKEWQKDKD